MKDQSTELSIRRILVALDASANSVAALEQAATLAANLEAELVGLFVEDVNLLRIASLPFARQICCPSGAEEILNSARLQRELRVRAEQARESLAAAAERAQTPWSFRIARGQVTAEILAAATDADLVLLGKAGWSPSPPAGLGSTALAIAASAPRALLLVQHGFRIGNRIITVFDGSDSSRRAAKVATLLAKVLQGILTVFIVADTPEIGEQREREVENFSGDLGPALRFRRLSESNPRQIAEAVRAEEDGLLVLGAPNQFTEERLIGSVLGAIPNSVLLIR